MVTGWLCFTSAYCLLTTYEIGLFYFSCIFFSQGLLVRFVSRESHCVLLESCVGEKKSVEDMQELISISHWTVFHPLKIVHVIIRRRNWYWSDCSHFAPSPDSVMWLCKHMYSFISLLANFGTASCIYHKLDWLSDPNQTGSHGWNYHLDSASAQADAFWNNVLS